MSHHASVLKLEQFQSLSVYMSVESDELLALGDRMNAIHPDAYMNGYNWRALVNYYAGKHAPQLLKDGFADPEAGTYVYVYDLTPANEQKAAALAKLINDLIADEEKLLTLIREEGDQIGWD